MREKLRRLLRVGYANDVFAEYRAEIDAANLSNLKNLSIAGTVIGFLLVLISLLPGTTVITLTVGYGILFVVMGAMMLASLTVLRRHTELVRCVWHILLLCTYLTGALLGTEWQPYTSAVTMIVFVVAVPLFVIERPVVIYALTGFMVAVFIALTNHYKTPYLARVDACNVCIFYVVGIMTYYQTVRAKMRDIVSRSQLRNQRDTDGLTGLRNRLYCETEINRRLADGMDAALFIMLDIDNFKRINDQYGHDSGDQALLSATEALQQNFRASDIIGRFGGDEFIAFLPSSTVNATVLSKIDTLLADIRKVHIQNSDACPMGASMGIACYPEDGVNFQQLFQKADQALYQAKHDGKGRYCLYRDIPKSEQEPKA